MAINALKQLRLPAVLAIGLAVFTACEDTPAGPEADAALEAQFAKQPPQSEIDRVVKTLRKVTDRYHNLNVALKDGFVLLHECEVRPGEGPVGMVYVHPGHVADGKARPRYPDALVYEPNPNGRPKLVAVEMAIPYSLWTRSEPPTFLGAEFQREDEFGVFGLHIWVWRQNPNGLFAEANPNITCDT